MDYIVFMPDPDKPHDVKLHRLMKKNPKYDISYKGFQYEVIFKDMNREKVCVSYIPDFYFEKLKKRDVVFIRDRSIALDFSYSAMFPFLLYLPLN
jgi:hypothetical protein